MGVQVWAVPIESFSRPPLADERASADLENDFGLAGFRVPTILSSPYARQNYVDHRVYDHTSTLRFLEWRFLGAPPPGPRGGSTRKPTPPDPPAHNNPAPLGATHPHPPLGDDPDPNQARPPHPG